MWKSPRSRPRRNWPHLIPICTTTLFGPRDLPFSITLVFPPFDGPNYDRALEKARASAEYREVGEGDGPPPSGAVFFDDWCG